MCTDGVQPLPEALGLCVSAAVQRAAQQHSTSLPGQHGQRKVPEQPAGAAGEDAKVLVKQHLFNFLALTKNCIQNQLLTEFYPSYSLLRQII